MSELKTSQTPKVFTLRLGQLDSNCYIYQINKKEAIIVDPGDEGDFIIQKLMEKELLPVAIYATHGHYDHILAGFTLQAAYNIPFYINQEDDFLLERMRATAMHFAEVDPGPAPIPTYSPKKSYFKILKTPGHTPGSQCFYDPKNSVIFTGDVVFADGSIGEADHKYSDRLKMKDSIKKILKLPLETIVYPGHGDMATILELREKFKWALI